ncbi:hypothetical protein [Shimia sp.]|uniref:hypothetical protein n=1 Tax=Shimia sp. TaxID=1954381 RepID=UPI0035618075
MNLRLLMRMAHWARHPPSAGRVKLVLAVIVICLALVAIETWVGWPEGWQSDRSLGLRPPR